MVNTSWWEIKESEAPTDNESWWDEYVQMPNSEPLRTLSPDLSEYIRRNKQAWRQGYEGETEGNT